MNINPDILEHETRYCENCPLKQNVYVVGLGDSESPILVVGSQPGQLESEIGVAFTGPSGVLVREILGSLGLYEDELYYTNVLKRQGSQSKPTAGECFVCGSHLVHEIVRSQPKVILALGSIPLQFLTGRKFTLGKMHGLPFKVNRFGLEIVVVPTYSPGHIIRQGGIVSTIGNEWVSDLEDFTRTVRRTM